MKKLIGLSLIVALLLTGCGSSKPAMQTPEETINTAFTALKELDMDTFNTCTNNKVVGGYRMLTDLFSNQDQEGYHQLAEAMVEHLSWEINNVEISEDTAVASVTIRNKDFSDTVGMFIGDLIQKVSQSQKDGMSLSAVIRTTLEEAKNNPEYTLPYLQKCDKYFSADAKINLKKTDNGWQILLDESLCDSLTGHLGSKNFSDHVSAKVSATEELLRRNLERWGVSPDETDQWAAKLEDKLKQFIH